MKKTILFFMLLLVSTFLFADDVIILRSSVRIDGKIESISNTELRYKKANDLTGATFITPLTEVSLIIWENGEVISYADIKAAPKPVAQKVKVTPKKENVTAKPIETTITPKRKWSLTPSDTTLMGVSVGIGMLRIPIDRRYDRWVDVPIYQLGYIFQPEFKYGLGVKTGVNLEFGGMPGYTFSVLDIGMNFPLQCSYRYEWFKGFSTLIYTGPIFDFGMVLKTKLHAQPYSDAYNFYSDGGYKGFNCLWGFGIAAQYNGWRFTFDGSVGMVYKYMGEINWGSQYSFGPVERYIHKPITLSIAYMFNCKKKEK